jgi:hypothetical protein
MPTAILGLFVLGVTLVQSDRGRGASEARPGPASDMMQAAPVVLSGQGVDVLIENIP